jgi:hypothetical protein
MTQLRSEAASNKASETNTWTNEGKALGHSFFCPEKTRGFIDIKDLVTSNISACRKITY